MPRPRAWAILALAALLVGLVPGVSAGTSASTAALAPAPSLPLVPFHWTSFQGSANRSDFSPLPGPSTLATGDATCPSRLPLRAGPVADDRRIYVGGALGALFALNRTINHSASTPEIVWNASLPGQPSQLELGNGTLVVGTRQGSLFDFVASNGSLLWHLTLPGGVVGSPLLVRGLVVVGTQSGYVEGIDSVTGSLAWRLQFASPVAGALASDGARLYGTLGDGSLFALGFDGTLVWRVLGPNPLETGPSIAGATVLVGDLRANVSAYSAANGSLQWRWPAPGYRHSDAIHAPPSSSATRAYVETDNGWLLSLELANGSLDWQLPGYYGGGYPETSGVVVTSAGLYVVQNGIQAIEYVRLNGTVVWDSALPSYTFAPLGLDTYQLLAASDSGCLTVLGSSNGPAPWPVKGIVLSPSGGPVPNATVTSGVVQTLTRPDGTFALQLPNGTYALVATARGFGPGEALVNVSGPTHGVVVRLTSLVTYRVSGVVLDASSGRPVPGASVTAAGRYGFTESVVTGRDGAFVLDGPNGSLTLDVSPPDGYGGLTAHVVVGGAPISGLVLRLSPVGLYALLRQDEPWLIVVPAVCLVAGLGAVGIWELARRRERTGLSPDLLSPFGRFVAMRALLIPAQAAILLTLIYLFGAYLVAYHQNLGAAFLTGNPDDSCSLTRFDCSTKAWFVGLGTFLERLFTGQWGWATLGNLREPVTSFVGWSMPPSIELAGISLALSMAIAYPVGLWAGWRRSGSVDGLARGATITGLLLPTFVVVLIVLNLVTPRFLAFFGDLPFGLIPSPSWYLTHGGFPSWVGVGDNTQPTGLPLVDAVVHGDWSFERLALAKTLLQAALIAVAYVAVFLRYARSVVADASR